MSWIEVIKGDKVVYSGTCPKCGEFVTRSQECPSKLHAKTPKIMTSDSCPMKLEK